MIKIKNLILIGSLIASFVFIECNTKSPQKEVITPIKEAITPIKEVEKAIDYEAIYNSLVIEYKPEITSEKEFKNFKNKSNYEDVIETYDVRNPPEILGGKSNKENIQREHTLLRTTNCY
jgi:hypothetical protein